MKTAKCLNLVCYLANLEDRLGSPLNDDKKDTKSATTRGKKKQNKTEQHSVHQEPQLPR